ncbi:hypothetical protein O181_109421 [Austropuccinia psidii MF-1]|uniref:Endonuclease/exonuclease/phosphatase domain-containing protein n=1 Tax=Austropuccinia psidii MF-1 TaxID=1389203 RepID=A0A9Q3PQW4_9BASI|nr:hypothetical protein [Austropuccinia psidii MF-1]
MLNFLTLNVRGLVSHHKQISLQDFSTQTSASLLFLQETNLSEESQIICPQPFHYILNSPVQQSSGVAIAINQEFFQEIKIKNHQNPVQGYLQVLEFTFQQQDYHLINVYMPHNSELATEVIQKINEQLYTIKEETILILAGDWNVTLKEEDRRNCSEIRTHLAQNVSIILNQHNLIDVWREEHPNKKQYTFRGLHQNHPMARLDRIYTKKKDLHLFCNTTIQPSFSDHSAVKIQLNTTKERYHPPYWKFDNVLLKSKEYQEIITNLITHFDEKTENLSQNINENMLI